MGSGLEKILNDEEIGKFENSDIAQENNLSEYKTKLNYNEWREKLIKNPLTKKYIKFVDGLYKY